MSAPRAQVPVVREPPARGEKVAALVARRIVRDIVERDLQPGASLEPEAEMLVRYGVSRASLREALRILETQGLITIKPGPGGGPSVAPVESRDFGRMSTLFFQVLRVRLNEVVQARLIIEPMCAALAAERATEADHAALREVIAAGDAAETERDWLAASGAFHSLILNLAGNTLLTLIAQSLKDIYTDRVAGLIFPHVERDEVRRAHAEIAAAIVAGDAATASLLMRAHMEEYARNTEQRHPGLLDEIVDWR